MPVREDCSSDVPVGIGVKLSVVAAVAANGVIGTEGRMAWHYPEDLAHFRETTVGHPVILGRRTFEAIRDRLGGPLPDRHNVVLTTRPESLPEGVVGVDSRAAARREARSTGATTAYVVGGASVYEQFLPEADELVLTALRESFDGDTTFPAVDWDNWRELDRQHHEAFDIVTYRRSGDASGE